MDTETKNIKNLQALLAMLSDDHLTKSDFLAEFEKVVKIIVEMQQRNVSEIEALKKAYSDVVDAIHTNVGGTVENLSKEASDAIQGHIKMMNDMHSAKMSEVDAKMATVTNGDDADPDAMMEQMKEDMMEPMMKECVDMVEKDLPKLGMAVVDSIRLLPEGEGLKTSDIEGLEEITKELNTKIEKIPSGGFGGGRANHAMKAYDLTSQTNGILKVFSVPKNITGFVISSDFPTLLMEGNGFSLNKTRTSLTLTPTNAPSSGSQLSFIYSEYFNT